ncbi:hypothetical protein B4100_2442 [Heyndrickxia coagulans]|nr:hypothetical protein B4100_2442 [Heyndrickxia coagulans]
MVTKDEIQDGDVLTIERRSHATTDMLLFSIPQFIHYN